MSVPERITVVGGLHRADLDLVAEREGLTYTVAPHEADPHDWIVVWSDESITHLAVP